MIENIILIAIIVAVIGGAAYYVYREKKKGVKCVGCPYAKECMSKRSAGNCGCGCDDGKK